MRKNIYLMMLFSFVLVSCGNQQAPEHSLILKENTLCKAHIKNYYECSKCHKIFLDSNAEQELTIKDIDHNYIYSFSDTDDGGQKNGTCQYCENNYSSRDLPMFNKKTYVTDSEIAIPYREYVPINIHEKVPLILFLHGSGERGNDNVSQLKNCIKEPFKQGNQNFFNSIVIAPQCPSAPSQWVNWDWSNGNYNLKDISESKVLDGVFNLIKNYSKKSIVDTSRIYIIGLSMGGFGVWDLIARHQDFFAAAVPICGGGALDCIEIYKQIPIYCFHGEDDSTVPYEKSTKIMYEKIKSAGGNLIKFVSFPNQGHGIWNNAITFSGDNNNPPLSEWLFSQSR